MDWDEWWQMTNRTWSSKSKISHVLIPGLTPSVVLPFPTHYPPVTFYPESQVHSNLPIPPWAWDLSTAWNALSLLATSIFVSEVGWSPCAFLGSWVFLQNLSLSFRSISFWFSLTSASSHTTSQLLGRTEGAVKDWWWERGSLSVSFGIGWLNDNPSPSLPPKAVFT